jgi:glycosyltransferase involved in cell wall biosynthesis
MSLKVCHISTVHPVYDDRIFFKECDAVIKNGNEIYLIVSHDKYEVINGVNIIPLSKREGRLYRVFVKQFSSFRKALNLKADIYHFHDPELIIMGLFLKICGKKVVYDVHEDVPLQILNKEWLGSIRVRKLISSTFNFIEKSIASKLDGIVTVTTDIAEKFSSSKRVLILRNLPIVSMIDDAVVKEIHHEKKVMIYAGGLTNIRGIKELIEVADILNGEVELWLLGKFDNLMFEKQCRGLPGFKYTKYFGYMPMNEVYSYMKQADIGMCTLYPTKNHLTSWPVKAFEYMSCGKPIIMSNFSYWKELFKENALFVDPTNSQEIANLIDNIIKNPEQTIEMGNYNRKIVLEKYSWEIESKKLLLFYTDICILK